MSDSVGVVWDETLAMYDFGRSHPLAPVRVELTIALARGLGLLDAGPVEVIGDVRTADDALLGTVHTADYIAAVRDAGDPMLPRAHLEYGLGTGDNPVFGGMHEASALVVSATMAAARAVWERRSQHAVNVAGGLHHAMPGTASGFCIYNDPAIAIRWLLDQGAQRVAYVDVDVHHGDGVQAVFYDDPRVLTISLHETGRTLFPGTGFPAETGGAGAEGTSVNVALPPGTKDDGVAARVPCGGAAAAAPLRAGDPGDPARLRHPRPRPARPPAADGGRAADDVRRPARPGARGLRRPVGGRRRRRLRAGPGGAPRVDAPDRRGGGGAGRPRPARHPTSGASSSGGGPARSRRCA